MADVKWIKITTDIFDDEKILLIESLPDAYAIITVWFKLLCLAGKQNNSGVFMMGRIPYTDKMLATIFRMKESTVTMALNTFEQFEMVQIVDGVYTIPNWGKHQSLDAYEKRKERDRLYQAEKRAAQRALALKSADSSSEKSSDVGILDRDIEEDKDKDIDKDKKKGAKQPSKADVDNFFDSVWVLYPVKKGKGQVSDAKRKTLFEIGFEKLNRAIERYLKELEKDAEWRKPQNGSTFFNSGYVDYLDENFVPDQPKQVGRKEKLPSWFGCNGLGDAERNAIAQLMSEDEEAERDQLAKELQAFGRKE
jgi:predicted phage replisome organizer